MKSRTLRARTSWIVAIILIPPFIVAFHMFSSPTQDAGPAGAAGIIFGKPIAWDVYLQQYTHTRGQWETRLAGSDGQPVDLPAFYEPLIIQETWDRLIIIEEAKHARLRISNEDLAAAIQRDPVFQQNGRFLPERYRQYVSAIGMSPQTFETFLRDQLLAQRLINAVTSPISVNDEEVRQAFVETNERLRVAMVVADPTTFEDAGRNTITKEALRSDYDTRPELVELPEQITFTYVGLTRDQLAETLSIAEEDVVTYYESYPERFTADDETARPLEEVREEIHDVLMPRAIRRRLNELALDLEDAVEAGQSFEGLAMALDLETRTVGPITVGPFVFEDAPEPDLLQAVFALDEGTMSDVVETDDGVYVGQVRRRDPPRAPPFEEVREAIQERLVQERAQETARASAEEWHAQLTDQRAGGATITEAAAQRGIPLRHPEPFTRTEPIEPLGAVPSVNRVAFATPIGELTDVMAIPQGFVLLIPQELIAPDEDRFPAQESALRQRLLTEKRNSTLTQWLTDLRARANLQRVVEQDSVEPQPGGLDAFGEPIR